MNALLVVCLAAAPLPEPTRQEALPGPTRFTIDPVADGAVFSLGLGFSVLSQLVISTGEIQPQQPVSPDRLLGIDRDTVDYGKHDHADLLSDLSVGTAGAYVLADAVLTGFRTSPEAGFVDGVLYGETAVVTWTFTNLTKIAVRRPRPRAYQQAQAGGPDYQIAATDDALSFFSGHTAQTAALAATATYLAFSRDTSRARGWVTAGVGTLLTAFVGWQRMRSGDHFPTDVIAGAMAGAGVGVLVPHLHREEDVRQRPAWIGMGESPAGTPTVLLGARF